MKAIVIGGGIAGLAAAVGLKRIGWQVEVWEQAQELRALGAGLVLGANALKALHALGVLENVQKVGQPLHFFRIQTQKGKVLANTNHQLISGQLGIQGSMSVHRAALQAVLLAAIAPVQVHTGKRCKSVTQHEQGVDISFEDGSTTTADLLIGCDGIHSAVRQQVAPRAKKRFAGYTCWRGVTTARPAAMEAHQASESWGRGDRFGIVPLSNNRVYWFACLNAAQAREPRMQAMGIPELQAQFKHYHPPVQELLSLTPPESLIWNDIIDMEPLPTYTYGRVVLAGDAAHATTPNMGQGACLALESVAVLIALLAEHPLPEALHEYDRQRVPRAGGIVRKSWQLGKIAQLHNPLGVWLRNTLLPLVPKAVNDKQMAELLDINLPEIPLRQPWADIPAKAL